MDKYGSVKAYRVESFRILQKYFLLKLERITSYEEAAVLVGAEVQIPESELLAPDDGEYYQFDLVGSRVVTVTGQEIGKVTDIVPAAGNDLLEVSRGDREVLIPFTKQICREVDILAKRIVIDPPEGLLDLNEV